MSKANQAFKHNDEAVSPVIGVILMVAITVVLAAVVFVLVSNLGEGSEAAPSVTFNKNSAQRELTVVSAEPSAWQDYSMSVSGAAVSAGCIAYLDHGATPTVSTPSGVTDSVSAGDSITLEETAPGDCAGATFRLTHAATNTLVYSTTF